MTTTTLSTAEARYLRLGKSGRLLVACWRTWFPNGLPDLVYASAQPGRLVLYAPSLLGGPRAGTPVRILQPAGRVPRLYLGARLTVLLEIARICSESWVHVTIEAQRLVLRPAGVPR